MKTIKQIITVVALAIFMMGTFNVNTQKNNPYNNVGLEHNKALDSYYNKLKNGKYTFDKSFDPFKESKEFTEGYLKIENVDLMLDKLHTDFKDTFENFNSIPKSMLPHLSENLIIMFNNIYSLNGDLSKISLFVQKINSDKSKTKLTKDEKEITLMVASVAYNSSKYWSLNYNKWKKLNPTATNQTKPKWWQRILGADVAGAIGGAVYAAGVNLIPGVGQVAYAGAIISTAVGASAGQAGVEIVEAM